MTKLFISHASADKALVSAFVDLLEGGVGVAPRDIFCSSRTGQSVKPGAHFDEAIRETLGASGCVVALISENFYASAFCMCELGGVWLTAKSFLPVLVPPLNFKSLKAVLEGVQVTMIDSAESLDQLRDELEERLAIKAHGTPRWNERRERFLAGLTNALNSIVVTAPVQRNVHEALKKKLAEYETTYQDQQAELERLKSVNAELLKTKDLAAAADVVRKHSTTAEAFEDLVNTANTALRRLPRIVREACYYQFGIGGDYYPEPNDWEDVTSAVEHGHLCLLNEDTSAALDEKDPKARKAIDALVALSSWLNEPPEDFEGWYAAEYEGIPELARRPFWDEHLSQ